MHWILRIASLVVLAVTSLFFIEDNVTTEWRRAQQVYRERLLATASNSGQKAYAESFEIRPRQIELAELGRVDRCVSCHVGMENPAAASWPQPLTAHGGDFLSHHDIERMGCTVCHDGQGRATTARSAHAWADGLHWDKPILRGDLLQATCVRCHNGPLPFASKFEQGKKLFDTRGCRGCHRLDGDGMALGPELTRVGDASFAAKHPTSTHRDLVARYARNVNAAYLFESVRYPHAQPDGSLMPEYGFSDAEAAMLTVYLKGQTARLSAVRIVPRAKEATKETLFTRGQRLFGRYCSGCHGPGGRGATPNPNAVKKTIPRLDRLAERLMLFDAEAVEGFVKYLDEHGGPPKDPDVLQLPRGQITLVQYRMVQNLVRTGNRSGKKDPKGPSPIDMPAWRKVLSDHDITAVMAWLLTQFPWDDE